MVIIKLLRNKFIYLFLLNYFRRLTKQHILVELNIYKIRVRNLLETKRLFKAHMQVHYSDLSQKCRSTMFCDITCLFSEFMRLIYCYFWVKLTHLIKQVLRMHGFI